MKECLALFSMQKWIFIVFIIKTEQKIVTKIGLFEVQIQSKSFRS